MKHVLAAVLSVALAACASAPERAEPPPPRPAPSAEEMLLDALVVRPLGLVSTALGTGVFIVSLPFTAAGGNVGQAADRLVVEPAKFTFTRPLGEFDYGRR